MKDYRACLKADRSYTKAFLLIGLAYAAKGQCEPAYKFFSAYAKRVKGAAKAVAKLEASCERDAKNVLRANTRTKVFHRKGPCRCRTCKAYFTSAEEAEHAGYKPCGRCAARKKALPKAGKGRAGPPPSKKKQRKGR
jgi:hypothetical protein